MDYAVTHVTRFQYRGPVSESIMEVRLTPRNDGRQEVQAFDLETNREGANPRVSLFGELDIAAAPRLDAELTQVEAEGPDRIVLDLRGLTFLDSTGLRSLLGADARARAADWALTLIKGPDVVQRVFAITGLEGRLDIVEDEAALASGSS